MSRPIELVTFGRCSIDLYSNDIGAKFVDIKSFGAFVGGCPTNIAVGARRLGLQTALVTATGDDPVGDFVVEFLKREKVETRFIARRQGFRTPAVLLGIEPPDKFPLVFYRERAPDWEMSVAEVEALPFKDIGAVLLTGTGLAREPSASATHRAAALARSAGATVYLDVDFRADQWKDARSFGPAVRGLLPSVDVVIGTEAELNAVAFSDALKVTIGDHQISSPQVAGNSGDAVQAFLSWGAPVVVLKRGEQGSSVFVASGERFDAPPFKVQVANVLGAGDAFAAGLIYARTRGRDWKTAATFGNGSGAIVVTRQACANAMPTERELATLVATAGVN